LGGSGGFERIFGYPNAQISNKKPLKSVQIRPIRPIRPIRSPIRLTKPSYWKLRRSFLRLKKRGLERNEFVFFDFFSKNQKKQTHFSPKGIKKKLLREMNLIF
jgi:hypothetical protein